MSEPLAQNGSYEAIDVYVEAQRLRLRIPGVSLAIVEGDRIVHLRGFGRARPGGEAPAPQTPFLIGSLTKSFTALAVMQLVEAGKVDLDAPVQRYLPWFRVADPQASAEMSVRHLLNQTSGLPTRYGEIPLADFDDRPDATERQARALSSLRLARPVGSACEYSNSNYNLLGLVIEAASGESYAEYIQGHIFAPLGMSHSHTAQGLVRQDGLATGHQYWFGFPVPAADIPIPRGSLPSGQLISCAEDLARYLIAQLNEGRCGGAQVLSSPGIAKLQCGAADFRAYGLSLGQYGMGWFIDRIGREKLVWHGGTLPHFAAYMALLPEQKKGLVLLFNASHHWMTPVLDEFGAGAAALLAGEQPAGLPFIGLIPWMLRGQLLIPALQIAGAAATLRLTRRRRSGPGRQPGSEPGAGTLVLLSLVPDLLAALCLKPLLGPRRGYLRLYMPDYSWIAMACGSFSLVWAALRTGLALRNLRKLPSPGPIAVLKRPSRSQGASRTRRLADSPGERPA